MGTECRYNGKHAKNDFIHNLLTHYADFYPFCPEAPTLGTPREPIQLVQAQGQTRIMGVTSGNDVTDLIQTYT